MVLIPLAYALHHSKSRMVYSTAFRLILIAVIVKLLLFVVVVECHYLINGLPVLLAFAYISSVFRKCMNAKSILGVIVGITLVTTWWSNKTGNHDVKFIASIHA
ncbi:MAG: hypothetical protein ACJ71M_11355 [Nitrososphaeraceae archaeon]